MLRLILALVLVLFPAVANAALVVDLIGDKDDFGITGTAGAPPDGTLWQDDLGGVFFTDYRTAAEILNAPFTDIWSSQQGVAYTHTYSLGGQTPVSGASEFPRFSGRGVGVVTVGESCQLLWMGVAAREPLTGIALPQCDSPGMGAVGRSFP